MNDDLKEALDLLELCRSCDLVYNYEEAIGMFADPDKYDPKTVADVVDEFLKKHGRSI